MMKHTEHKQPQNKGTRKGDRGAVHGHAGGRNDKETPTPVSARLVSSEVTCHSPSVIRSYNVHHNHCIATFV